MSIICIRLCLRKLDKLARISNVNQVRTLYRRFCMIIENYQQTINQLSESNPDFKAAFERVIDENRLILSRFTHELRNPLTLVRSTIQLIESQHPEVVDYKYWTELLTDVDDTVNLLNELSLYNHCDQLQLDEINFIQLIQQSVEGMKPLASDKNLSIHFIYDDQALSFNSYSCDRIKLKQVLTNLLKNAIEAADLDSTIIVELSLLTNSKTNGQYIQVAITDSGAPIPPENLAVIFEPFVTFKSNGTGLGLAISKRIAKLHQGDLLVSQTESAVTFTLQLPMNVSADVTLSVAL